METLETLTTDCSPEATHQLYIAAPEIPRLMPDELFERLHRLDEQGYQSIGGILVKSWIISVTTALSMHELAQNHFDKGAIVGPYCMSYGIALPGVRLYMPSRQTNV